MFEQNCKISKEYWANGVSITQEPSALRLNYKGLLANSGAPEVVAHIGFGDCWTGTQVHRMNKTSNGFELSIPWELRDSRVNVCFSDLADNYDNHSGINYKFEPEL